MVHEVAGQKSVDVKRRSGSLVDPMGPVRIRHHVELLPGLDKAVDEGLSALVVNIVIPRAVNRRRFPSSWWAKVMGDPSAFSWGSPMHLSW